MAAKSLPPKPKRLLLLNALICPLFNARARVRPRALALKKRALLVGNVEGCQRVDCTDTVGLRSAISIVGSSNKAYGVNRDVEGVGLRAHT